MLIAADNLFYVEINGVEVGELDGFYDGGYSISGNYFSSLTGPISVKSYLVDGPNTIKVTVKNLALSGGTSETNPAGLLYDLKIVSKDCSVDEIKDDDIDEGDDIDEEDDDVDDEDIPTGGYEEPDTTPVDLCSNIDGVQTVVPRGKVLKDGRCIPKTVRGSSIMNNDNGQVLGASTSCGLYIDKYLRKGYNNNSEDVKKIQKFLNEYLSTNLTEDGVFGNKTESALKAFQLKHADKILTPWNLQEPTGIFYLTTQAEVNNIMCPELNLPIPSSLIPFSQNLSVIQG